MATPFEYIRSDLFRYEGETSIRAMIGEYFRNRSFRYTFWMRLCRTRLLPLRLLAKVMHRLLSNKYLIEIPWSTSIGHGLYIGHHMCVVISGSAIIGNNCNLSQFVTIGTNHGKAATIGDNVYIGPGVCIVEDIKIGSFATIGAGAVVVKDVLEGSTVAGSPARVISNKTPGRYVKHPWVIRG
jgi:serine O-acetyltransferase